MWPAISCPLQQVALGPGREKAVAARAGLGEVG